MGDDEYPSVEVDLRSEVIETREADHRFVHIDEFDGDVETGIELHLYAFEEDDKYNELVAEMADLRNQHIYAMGIVWPDNVRDEVEEAETEVLLGLEWALQMSANVDREDVPKMLEAVKEHVGEEQKRYIDSV